MQGMVGVEEESGAGDAPVAGAPVRIAEPTRRSEFWAGLRATLPLVLGAIPFGIIFGAVAVNSGLSGGTAAAMSAFVFAGSSQFIATGLVAGGAGLLVIIVTTFVVNLRHALYSVSLAPHVKHLPQRWLLPLGFWLTDETYLVVINRYNQGDGSPWKHWYYLGSAVVMYVNWNVCTWVGIAAGRSIANPQAWGLEFALPLTFIGMLVPAVSRSSTLVTVVTAGGAALAFAGLPNKLGLFIAALLGVAAGMVARRLDRSDAPEPVLERTGA